MQEDVETGGGMSITLSNLANLAIIAQGALFVVKGTNLGPASLALAMVR